MPIANSCSIGYPHDGRADNAAYRHDRRADNAAYRHDRRADSLSRNLYATSYGPEQENRENIFEFFKSVKINHRENKSP